MLTKFQWQCHRQLFSVWPNDHRLQQDKHGADPAHKNPRDSSLVHTGLGIEDKGSLKLTGTDEIMTSYVGDAVWFADTQNQTAPWVQNMIEGQHKSAPCHYSKRRSGNWGRAKKVILFQMFLILHPQALSVLFQVAAIIALWQDRLHVISFSVSWSKFKVKSSSE